MILRMISESSATSTFMVFTRLFSFWFNDVLSGSIELEPKPQKLWTDKCSLQIATVKSRLTISKNFSLQSAILERDGDTLSGTVEFRPWKR